MNPFKDSVYIKILGFVFAMLESGLAQPLTINQNSFVVVPICITQETIDNGCLVFQAVVRSLLECVSLCSSKASCQGTTLSPDKKCYFHKSCDVDPPCDLMEVNYSHAVKTNASPLCYNGGKWHFHRSRCICVNGWVTDDCTVLANKCYDLLVDGGYHVGYHKVQLDLDDTGQDLINTVCTIPNKGSKDAYVIAMANNGLYNFNRTWNEYVNGFGGETVDNVWVGLENMYRLNQKGHVTFYIRLYFKGYTMLKYKRQYKDFSMGGAAHGYCFAYRITQVDNGPEEALLGCLDIEFKMLFSTWDNDQDRATSKNCASIHGAGWWYDDCTVTCHPLAYTKGSDTDMQNVDGSVMANHFKSIEFMMKSPRT